VTNEGPVIRNSVIPDAELIPGASVRFVTDRHTGRVEHRVRLTPAAIKRMSDLQQTQFHEGLRLITESLKARPTTTTTPGAER
jgi:hypothetical protein